MKFKIYRRKKKLTGIVSYSKKAPYIFNPSYRKNDEIIDISKLSIYNSKMIDNILSQKYVRKYKELLKLVYLLYNDAFPGDVGYPAVLDEIAKLRSKLIDKYNKYLSLSKKKKFLKELDYIESEVKMRYVERRVFESQIMGLDNLKR